MTRVAVEPNSIKYEEFGLSCFFSMLDISRIDPGWAPASTPCRLNRSYELRAHTSLVYQTMK